MTVMEGGTGNLTLGAVTGFPTIASTLGTNKDFHYALLNTNLSPIEIGQGVMTNATTLQRSTVEGAMIEGELISDGTKADVPVGAVMFTAPTANSLLELVLEQKTVDYGNVSGAVTLDFKNACIVANITADTTFTVDTATLPPAGTHHVIDLKLKSNNNPALTTPFQAGFMVTLAGTGFFVDGGVTGFPPMRLNGAGGSEMTLRLTNIAGSTNYRVENISKHEINHNLGVIPSGNFALDIRRPWNIGEFTGGDNLYVLNGISPDVGILEPAHFTFINNGSANKTLRINTSLLSVAGSTIGDVLVPIGYKVDLDVRRNPVNAAQSYEVKIGDVNYNQTASGLATTWNPSDYSGSTNLTLSNNNRIVEMTTSAGNNVSRGARAFGGKNQGKWYFSVRVNIAQAVTSGVNNHYAIGVATLAHLLSAIVGTNVNSGSFYRQNPAGTTGSYDDTVFTARASPAYTQQAGDINTILFDADTGKGYLVINNTPMYGANPEAGTNPLFTVATGNLYLPMISLMEQGSTTTAGQHEFLNEIEALHIASLFPSWAGRYWTA